MPFPAFGWNPHTIVALLLVALFVPFALTGGVSGPFAWIYERFGFSRDKFLSGQFWQLATHPFLHGDWLHVLSNALFLFYFGGRISAIFGASEFWRICGWAILGGSLMHLLFQPVAYPLVGSSAAGMGLFMALTTVSPESRMIPFNLRARNLRDGVLIASLLLFLITPAYQIPVFKTIGQALVQMGGESLFHVGHAYHLGGAFAGWLMMRKYLKQPITLAQLKKDRARRESDNNAAA